jgi:DNA integrity scanning protein DisA with diadenylate cyclase activity
MQLSAAAIFGNYVVQQQYELLPKIIRLNELTTSGLMVWFKRLQDISAKSTAHADAVSACVRGAIWMRNVQLVHTCRKFMRPNPLSNV